MELQIDALDPKNMLITKKKKFRIEIKAQHVFLFTNGNFINHEEKVKRHLETVSTEIHTKMITG